MNATAIGAVASASANNAIAIGNVASSTQRGAIAIGSNANATAIGSIVVGGSSAESVAQATGQNSIAIGLGARATQRNAVAIGLNAVANTADTLVYSGDIECNNVINPSDRKLKYVGEAFKGGLEEVKKLEVFNYTFKKDEKKTPRVGVIAQDLQKIFPAAVIKGGDGFLRIRFEDMFYAVVNAIKELDAKITETFDRIALLEKKNQELERQNKELVKKLDDLESRVKKLEKNLK